jgi:hypothetical protein
MVKTQRGEEEEEVVVVICSKRRKMLAVCCPGSLMPAATVCAQWYCCRGKSENKEMYNESIE